MKLNLISSTLKPFATEFLPTSHSKSTIMLRTSTEKGILTGTYEIVRIGNIQKPCFVVQILANILLE